MSNRFKYLEGLRGIAALYVVFYHFIAWELPPGLPSFLRYATIWASFGHFAVGVFIVLSGYCLMLPVVQSADIKLRGGVLAYFRRRAKRILPPYYAALILSILMLILSPEGLEYLGGIYNPNWLANFEIGNIVSHIFLLHNLHPKWVSSINSPMWSLSTEWEIYFLFPILLLPIWRYFGNFFLLLTGTLIGIAPHYIFPSEYNFDWACPWYVALFTMGMIGADISNSKQIKINNYIFSKYILPLVGIISIILYVSAKFLHSQGGSYLKDILGGIITLVIIIYCSLLSKQKKTNDYILSILESNLIMKISTFSYSLYLFHWIVLIKTFQIIKIFNLEPSVQIAFRGFVGIPVALFFSYLFYLAFERPFLKSK